MVPESMSEPDDITLMLRASEEDDREAFAMIVRRHQQPLMNFFWRVGVNEDVEDLAQETFVRLYRYRKRYKPTAKLTTFLYLLARQVRIDALRRGQRRGALHERVAAESEQFEEPSASATGEALDAMAALARLSEAMREVVVLSVMQGLTQSEVADVLKIPVGTVKSRLFVALQRLRADLEPSPHAEET